MERILLRYSVQIKPIVAKIAPNTYLQTKVNRIIEQRSNSYECGFFTMKFLVDCYKGIPFKDATRYSEITKSEQEIKPFETLMVKRL